MSHIGNYDIRFTLLVGVLVGSIALLADWFLRYSFWFGGGRRRDGDGDRGGGGAQAILFLIAHRPRRDRADHRPHGPAGGQPATRIVGRRLGGGADAESRSAWREPCAPSPTTPRCWRSPTAPPSTCTSSTPSSRSSSGRPRCGTPTRRSPSASPCCADWPASSARIRARSPDRSIGCRSNRALCYRRTPIRDDERGPPPRRAEVAQLVEHRPEEAGVVSSNLTLGTIFDARIGRETGGSGSVGRASPCQGEGRGFESRLPLHFYALLAMTC